MRLAGIKISLRFCEVQSEYSLGAFWIAKDAKFSHEDWKTLVRLCGCTGDLSVCWWHMSENVFFSCWHSFIH